MLPCAFSRLRSKKIVLDPLFIGLVDPDFSIQVLNNVFDRERAVALRRALPRPWSPESLSSLAPFDLLFHYTVNTLQPLLGLKAEKESNSKSVKQFQALGSYLWNAAYHLHFAYLPFTHRIKKWL